MFYLNKNDRTSHWVTHSKTRELDTIELLKRKHLIEDMESELTESSKLNSKTDNLAVTENADIDEAIQIYLKK